MLSLRERVMQLDEDPKGGGGTGTASEPTLTLQIDGKDVTIPKPKGIYTEEEIGEKFVPKGAHNDQMARVRRELDAFKGFRKPEDLFEDEKFKAEAVEKWGLNPAKTNAELQMQVARAKAELDAREVKPRDEKITKLDGEVGKLRTKDLYGQIIRAAAGRVRPELLKAPTKGGQPIIVGMLRDTFSFDPEHGEWFAKGQNTPFAFSQGGDLPYQGIEEFLEAWANGEGKAFAVEQRQSGAEANASKPGASGVVGRELRVTVAQMRDIPLFKKLTEKAEKEGLTIIPIS